MKRAQTECKVWSHVTMRAAAWMVPYKQPRSTQHSDGPGKTGTILNKGAATKAQVQPDTSRGGLPTVPVFTGVKGAVNGMPSRPVEPFGNTIDGAVMVPPKFHGHHGSSDLPALETASVGQKELYLGPQAIEDRVSNLVDMAASAVPSPLTAVFLPSRTVSGPKCRKDGRQFDGPLHPWWITVATNRHGPPYFRRRGRFVTSSDLRLGSLPPGSREVKRLRRKTNPSSCINQLSTSWVPQPKFPAGYHWWPPAFPREFDRITVHVPIRNPCQIGFSMIPDRNRALQAQANKHVALKTRYTSRYTYLRDAISKHSESLQSSPVGASSAAKELQAKESQVDAVPPEQAMSSSMDVDEETYDGEEEWYGRS
ncbi:hypothetical protein B0H11DRAFT_1901388 [Mycena galericulata]|nr:hypothetical protein B0H11DRAFT_1901388 [Mycena galericulata]